MKKLIVIFLFTFWFIKALAFENSFFKVEVPDGWITKTDKDFVPLMNYPYELNVFMDDEEHAHQFFYTYISKQMPEPQEVIRIHIEQFLDNSGLEKSCSYSEEQFHGCNAVKYVFCGKLFGAYGRGIAYSFLDNGHVFLFFNFFVPNVFEYREEYNVWDKLEIFDKERWSFD